MNQMQIAIIKKDLRGLVYNKRLFPALLIVPLIFTLVLPTILILTVRFAPEEIGQMQQVLALLPAGEQSENLQLQVVGLMFNYIMPVFFIIIPIMSASIMAASSFVGEKEKRTLETLLYAPLSLRQIFQAKIFASFFLSMFVSFLSFVLMILAVETELFLLLGSPLMFNANWLVTMLMLSPAISLMAIILIVRGSAKAQSAEEAQQRTIFLILPIMLLIVGQFTGVLLINTWWLLGISVLFVLLACFLMKSGWHKFSYEAILK
jgi:ABC-type Na+ efflux pump permease subunit